MSTEWLVTAAAAVSALGIIWAALRRLVLAVVDFVRVGRDVLALQPRVVELAEQLVDLVERDADHERRLTRVEATVFPLTERTSHA